MPEASRDRSLGTFGKEKQVFLLTRNPYTESMNYIDTFKTKPPAQQDSEIDDKISGSYHELIHTEAAASATASTNASGWFCDEYYDVEFEIEEDTIVVTLGWHATGDQDSDKGYCGTTISGNATAKINSDGGVTFEDVSAEVDHDDE